MTAAGIDVGTGGVRAVVLDDEGSLLARSSAPLLPGRRTADGGHRLDDGSMMRAALGVLSEACGGRRPDAVAVSSTSGTMCFRDGADRPAAEAVAYDDSRHGTGLARVAAWRREVPGAVRLIPPGDAVLEALGAEPGETDWTSGLKLGWDPLSQSWPAEAEALGEGFLPRAAPPGTPCGRIREGGPGAGAMLVRGVTDGCAMQMASGPLHTGRWSISLGTTLTWKTVALGGPPALPPGAYSHRLADDVWLPGAASNTGGGVLLALEPGADLRARDREAVLPSRFAAYPLARPGERFPVPNPHFTGFGLPPSDHPAFHAAILEGVGYVMRCGIERLLGGGIPDWDTFRVTGGGARSTTWMTVIASVLRRTVVSTPEVDAALGAALIALAASRGQPVGSVAAAPGALGPVREHVVDQGLRPSYAGGYSTFLGILSRLGTELSGGSNSSGR